MTATRILPRLALLASVALLPGCGLTVEHTARVQGLERDLAESRSRGQALTTQVATLEGTLATERAARGDLTQLERRLARARTDLGSAQQGRGTAEQQAASLAQQAEAEERRLAGLRGEAGQTQMMLDERRAAVASTEARLAGLRQEMPVNSSASRAAQRHRRLRGTGRRPWRPGGRRGTPARRPARRGGRG